MRLWEGAVSLASMNKPIIEASSTAMKLLTHSFWQSMLSLVPWQSSITVLFLILQQPVGILHQPHEEYEVL